MKSENLAKLLLTVNAAAAGCITPPSAEERVAGIRRLVSNFKVAERDSGKHNFIPGGDYVVLERVPGSIGTEFIMLIDVNRDGKVDFVRARIGSDSPFDDFRSQPAQYLNLSRAPEEVRKEYQRLYEKHHPAGQRNFGR